MGSLRRGPDEQAVFERRSAEIAGENYVGGPRWGYRWVIVLVGSGAALSLLAQILVSAKLQQWQRIGITGTGMICIALASVLPLIQQRKHARALIEAEEAADTARLETQTEFQDSLMPTAAILSAIAGEQTVERRRELKSALIRVIVSRAAREIGPNRTRACYFQFDQGSPKSLTCHDVWEGRGTRPSDPYTEATQLGRIALTMVARRESSFRPNLEVEAPEDWPREREYKTFAAVTVAAKAQLFGMLTIDSLEPGDLSDDDVPQMQLLADLLAVGLTSRAELGGPNE